MQAMIVGIIGMGSPMPKRLAETSMSSVTGLELGKDANPVLRYYGANATREEGSANLGRGVRHD
jgi:hypothetical protein